MIDDGGRFSFPLGFLVAAAAVVIVPLQFDLWEWAEWTSMLLAASLGLCSGWLFIRGFWQRARRTEIEDERRTRVEISPSVSDWSSIDALIRRGGNLMDSLAMIRDEGRPMEDEARQVGVWVGDVRAELRKFGSGMESAWWTGDIRRISIGAGPLFLFVKDRTSELKALRANPSRVGSPGG